MSELYLPDGWAFSTLTTSISADGIISDGDWVESKDQDPNGSVRLIQLADIGDGDFKNKSERFMTSESATALNCTFLKSGDVLIARMPDPLGRACLFPGVGQEAVTVVDVCLIRTGEKAAISNRILTYWINSPAMRNLIDENASGTTRRRITRKKLEKFEFPLPPLAEQKVIADKLDKLLAQVESTKARLERIPDILKRFRQSVLSAAVSGKLTEEWRNMCGYELKKYCDSSELSVFRDYELSSLPDTWQWLRFDQVADIASNLVDPFDNLGEIHIAPNHIESWTGAVSGYQTVEEDGVTSAKHRFKKGQVLYSKIRPYLAKVAIAKFDGLCSADMYPINSLINTQYLYRWMLTSIFTDWASNAESRSVLPKINQKDLSMIPVPTPPIEEQTEIVRRVEELFAFADSIEQKATAALERVNNLTQSILAKAFSGELTADWRAANPELICGENSAEALIAKIAAERKATAGKKTRKKA